MTQDTLVAEKQQVEQEVDTQVATARPPATVEALFAGVVKLGPAPQKDVWAEPGS